MKNEALDLIKFDGYEKQSLFYGRISKNLRKLSKRIERKRVKYIEKKKCAYQPAWDWKKETVVFSRLLLSEGPFEVSVTNTGTGYSKIDPCEAVDFIFLSFKRSIELFTVNCKNKYHQNSIKQLNQERDEIFKRLKNPVCHEQIEKYNIAL